MKIVLEEPSPAKKEKISSCKSIQITQRRQFYRSSKSLGNSTVNWKIYLVKRRGCNGLIIDCTVFVNKEWDESSENNRASCQTRSFSDHFLKLIPRIVVISWLFYFEIVPFWLYLLLSFLYFLYVGCIKVAI